MGEYILLMSADYYGVLERLKQERIAHDMSQEELGRLVRITQGHYSKVENAIKRFTYYEVKSLAETGLDLYYIFTGRRADKKYKELFAHCSYRELCCYLGMASSMVACLYEEQKLDLNKTVYEHVCCVRYIAGAADSVGGSIFSLLRHFEKKTQSEMAVQLGMDIKKYRELEKGGTLPDSELIWKLSSMYGVPPALVVNDTNGLAGEIGDLLNWMETGRQGVVFRHFCLLREYYTSII